ncbi:hypothetical protein BJP36_39525 [Moorena producens JHB]|uniref:Uncharacterized protein n=1 Tax=Moorena producens (strain JHB) TaxID=1454205 RepID=A0A9Q9UWQ5_MOOP1|nr:hypothetical protein [Moorena producens]WAN70146.1 hypothetical protein BJP36_39525 [Moorena producens JHB]
MRYTKLFPSFLFRLYCSLLLAPWSSVPAPCSLLPAPQSLLPAP